jgi:hypothetical protein
MGSSARSRLRNHELVWRVVRPTLTASWFAMALAARVEAQTQQPVTVWTQGRGYQAMAIVSGYLNGDSRPDFVIGYSEPQCQSSADSCQSSLLAIDSDGNFLWRFQANTWVWEVAIGDIDGDGRDDVAAYEYQSPNYLYAIGASGAELWRRRLAVTGSGNEFADHIRIGDVTGDGRNEVIVGVAGYGGVFVFDSHGSLVVSHDISSEPESGSVTSIELADLNADGMDDIVVSYGYRCPPCGIEVIDGFGNVLWDFPTPLRLGDAATGDINGDGRPDVVVGEWNDGHGVYAIDSSGDLLWKFEHAGPASGNGGAPLALGDIDRDGRIDVVFGSFQDGHVYVLDGDGRVMWTFNARARVSRVAIGDVDGDGRNEIAATTVVDYETVAGQVGVYALDSDGTLLWFSPKSASHAVPGFWDLVVIDVNGDGRAEVIAVQADLGTGENGFAVALATSNACIYRLWENGAVIGHDGGPITLRLDTQPGCEWSTFSLADWIITPPGGVGPPTDGIITINVAVNESSSTRLGWIYVSGHPIPITQAGALPVRRTLDVNGDGRLDLIWQHQTDGRLAAWTMAGTTEIGGLALTPAQLLDTSWKVVGTGDLDGDGHADLVWQNIVDGSVGVWLMDGATVREQSGLSIPRVADPNWRIGTVGDLNGDGRADLVWWNQRWSQRGTQSIAVWVMNGLQVVFATLCDLSESVGLAPPIGNMEPVGNADFDGDGDLDLVFQNQVTTEALIVYMDGLEGRGWNPVPFTPLQDTDWKIRAVGDFDGDAKPDLIWQHVTSGALGAWLMDNAHLRSGGLLSPPAVADLGWRIVGPR